MSMRTREEREARYKARAEFLEEVVDFAQKLLRERGHILKNEENSSWTHIVRELKFGGFLFHEEHRRSSTIKIFCADESHNRGMTLLEVRWGGGLFSVEECRVEVFCRDFEWTKDLEQVMAHRDQIIAGDDTRVSMDAEEERKRRERWEWDEAMTDKESRLAL
jgi:hypothetical protein